MVTGIAFMAVVFALVLLTPVAHKAYLSLMYERSLKKIGDSTEKTDD